MIILGSRRFIKGPTALRLMRRGGGAPAGPDFSTAVIGDEIEGGYFAAIMLDGTGAEYALSVSPKAQGDPGGIVTLSTATSFATGLSIGGHSDWSIPTIDELRMVYRAFKPTTQGNNTGYGATDRVDPPLGNYTSNDPSQTSITAFQSGGPEAFVNDYYWSTTDGGFSSNAVTLFFGNGYEKDQSKNNSYLARAIRRVPV